MPRNLKNVTLWVPFLTCLLVCLAINPASGAKAKCWHVYPSMTRLAIQAIVAGASNGDTVLFHAGTYDWSDAPLVHRWESTGAINIVDKTLKLQGEANVVLLGHPSIDGTGGDALGVNAFQIIDLDMNNDVTFDRLNFQTFLRGIGCGFISYHDPENAYEIAEPNARNLTITNCTFSDIHRDAISISYIGGNVLIQNNSMSVARVGLFCSWYWSADHLAWQPEDTYIQLLDNDIASPRSGLYFGQTKNVIVINNKISGPLYGIDMAGTDNGAFIAANLLSNCLECISIYGIANGAVVERNEMKNVTEYGIWLEGDDCHDNTISKNLIEMVASSWCGIGSSANNNYYGQNKIRGTGSTAINLYTGGLGSAYKETLQANNINNFTPDICHFFLGPMTHDNLIVGSGMGTNTYYDLGTNNRITGVTPLPGGIGQHIIDAIHLRNEKLKQAREVIH
jgi:hypothetical protein